MNEEQEDSLDRDGECMVIARVTLGRYDYSDRDKQMGVDDMIRERIREARLTQALLNLQEDLDHKFLADPPPRHDRDNEED